MRDYGPLTEVGLLNDLVLRGELLDDPAEPVLRLYKAEVLTHKFAPVEPDDKADWRWVKVPWPVTIPRTSVAWWTETERPASPNEERRAAELRETEKHIEPFPPDGDEKEREN